MKAKLTAVASAIGAIALAPQAFASTGTVTYQGIVNNTQTIIPGVTEPLPDVDGADLFGGGNLEGDQITASFSYSAALGSRSGFGDTYDQLVGGISYFASSPITSATFTIAGYSYTYTPDYSAIAYTQSVAAGAGYGLVEDSAYSLSQDQALVAIVADDAPASLFTSFSSALAPTTGSFFDPGSTKTGIYDSINFDTISVAVSAIPEPSTWGLMILGVSLVGVTLRRRHRSASPSAAV